MTMKAPGVRGAGTPPNRSTDYSRERDATKRVDPPTKGQMRRVFVPSPSPYWHPIAKMMFSAAKQSGMVDFYQQSDWAYLYSLMDDLSRLKKEADNGGRINGQIFTGIYNALSALGFTEGDRRRMRIELEKPDDGSNDAAQEAIAEYQNVLSIKNGKSGKKAV